MILEARGSAGGLPAVGVRVWMDGAPGGGAPPPASTLAPPGTHPSDSGHAPPPPLLLLHGFTGCAESWGEEILAPLSRDRTVFALDLPGHGSAHAVPRGWEGGIEGVVEAICALLDAQGIERADWVGYSMGGRVALAGAVRRPERFRRLVLESASPGIAESLDRARRRYEDEELARIIEDRGIEWFVDYWMGLPLFESQARLDPDRLRKSRALRRKCHPEGLAAALLGYGTGSQPSYWDALQSVEVPTLLLTGALDPRFEAIGDRMGELLPCPERHSIPDVGHNIHLETPDRWLHTVLEFLGGGPEG